MMDLADFAKAEFALTIKGKDGFSKLDHLLNAWDQSGKMPQELQDKPSLPEECRIVWEYFNQLNLRRQNNGMSISPLAPSEVMNWLALFKIRLDAWELNAIFMLDTHFVASRLAP